ncbi:unnamed protein product [Schistosoma curassoni]|uniref:Sema domain-containing protein n=1 Tax=Schistosoma curassoni TaxID=6186 RepID=A0A183KDP3_9TREM|nr:unnamed protein product [Schistosoma curassoni]
MVFGGSQQETRDPGFVLLGTRQQGLPVILRELVLPGGSGPVLPSFTVGDVTTELSGPRLTSCRTAFSTSNHHLISIYSARSVESPRLVTTLQHGR